MKISIVTPVYNGEKYIKRTLDSIVNQSYTNFECIVVDALSKDNTLQIVKSYSSFKYISEKDNGQSEALNKGFKLCDGDIFAWQNADDIYFPDAFEKVAYFFQEHPDIDIVYGNYILIDENDKSLVQVRPPAWNKWLFMHGRFCPVQPTVFWRRKVHEKVGILNENLHFCMDVDFYSRAIKNGFRISLLPEFLGKFRVHNDSKTQNKDNYIKMYKEYKNLLSRHFNYKWYNYLVFNFFKVRTTLSRIVQSI